MAHLAQESSVNAGLWPWLWFEASQLHIAKAIGGSSCNSRDTTLSNLHLPDIKLLATSEGNHPVTYFKSLSFISFITDKNKGKAQPQK